MGPIPTLFHRGLEKIKSHLYTKQKVRTQSEVNTKDRHIMMHAYNPELEKNKNCTIFEASLVYTVKIQATKGI